MKEFIARPKIILSVGEVKPGAPVTPLLGPHNIEVSKFIERFNKQTEKLATGVEVVAHIKKYNRSTYDIFIKPTPINRIFVNSENIIINNNVSSVEHLFDIFRLKIQLYSYFNDTKVKENQVVNFAKVFIGGVKSIHNIKIDKNFYNNYDFQSID